MNDVNYLKQNGLCFNCFVGSHHSSQCDKPVKRVEVAQHLTNQRVFVGTEPIVGGRDFCGDALRVSLLSFATFVSHLIFDLTYFLGDVTNIKAFGL
jgi:hypothetical protein